MESFSTNRKYTKELAQASYDAIVIGSGLGGLTTASFLARNGKKVIIFEKHNVPGGFTHTFKRKGYEWDVGVHYVGQMGDPKNLMRKLFDYITDSQLQWASMGELYDRIKIGAKTYDFIKGEDKLIRELVSKFPEEEKAIHRYFKLIKSVSQSTGFFFGERSMPWFLSYTIGFFMRLFTNKWAQKTTYEVLRQLTANEELIAVLCGQCGDYGLTPQKSSFAIHAGLVGHYLEGGYYPVGGAGSIYQKILQGIESRGGRLVLATEVESILVDRNKATGVRLKNGDSVFAKKIISNAGARNTFMRLWPQSVKLPSRIQKQLQEIRPSMAHVCLYVGLKASDEQLQLPKNNIWLYENKNFDAHFDKQLQHPSFEPPLTYISFPSAKDPAWAQKHPHKATVQIIAPCPYAWVEQWKTQSWLKRDEEYAAFKEQWQKSLLEKLLSVAPQVKDFVDHCEVSTPLTTQHFSNYQNGEIYGLEHTPARMKVKWLRAHTPIKNLFLTGQDIVMVGVGGALFSGVITSVALLRKNVLAPVFKINRS
ncbi:MAG: NAD(P)/FAD-dependent oxidoreductase [Bdellovibrionaceae bacterium]|nr:NAD(P)/FAD-dependent oxidoreductase [Pseudobdellovibrionaceae bacterium]